jgi:hypothetical protein
MMIGFKISESGMPEFFDQESKNVFMTQGHWPDGHSWTSIDEATSWALAYVESINNPESEMIAGSFYPNVLVTRISQMEYNDAIVEASEAEEEKFLSSLRQGMPTELPDSEEQDVFEDETQ